MRSLLVPQRQLSGELRVLIDSRLNMQRSIDQLRLGKVVDHRRSVVFAVAAAGNPSNEIVTVGRSEGQNLDELLADSEATNDVPERAAEILRHWNTRRLNSAWERLGRGDEELGESPTTAFRRLRLEMLAAERKTFIEERDAGRINDEVLRSMLHGLDLEEATLNRS